MPEGKPANTPCVNLDLESYSCKIWGQDNYPEFCRKFIACKSVCGDSRTQALELITTLEQATN
jgi:hypothetical protein